MRASRGGAQRRSCSARTRRGERTATPIRESHTGRTLQLEYATIRLESGGTSLTIVLTAVAQRGYWRVEMAWPNKRPHFFGKFRSQAEAEKWIAENRWLTEQRTNIINAGAAHPEDPEPTK